jgi:hypothetical protein
MKFLTNYQIIIYLSVAILFTNCKKQQSFDEKPVATINGNIIFSPEATGTVATDQNNLMLLPSPDYFKSVPVSDDSAFGYLTLYTDKGVYFNTNANSDQSATYDIAVTTPLFKRSALATGTYTSEAGTYAYPVTNPVNANYKIPGGYMKAQATSYNYLGTWVSAVSNGSTAFDFTALPDSYIKITYSKIYTRKLEDGVHTYIDGSLDVTMLGYQYPQPPNGQIYFENQANVTATFSGLEITNY